MGNFFAGSLDNKLVTPASVLGCWSLMRVCHRPKVRSAASRHDDFGTNDQEFLIIRADGGIGRRASLRN